MIEIIDFQQKQIPSIVKVAYIQTLLPITNDPVLSLQQRQIKAVDDIYYQDLVIKKVQQALDEGCNWIVLPELATSEKIEKKICKVVCDYPQDVGVICGSYYRSNANVSPVIFKIGNKEKVFYQNKLFPSKEEKKYLVSDAQRYVFVNTGIGDAAVFICYDANDWTIFRYMEGLVDILFVIAYNRSIGQFCHYFQRGCYENYYYIVHCNDAKYGQSSFFIPYRNYAERKQQALGSGIIGSKMIDLDILTLDESRKRNERTVLKEIELADPPKNISSRYDPRQRTLDHFKELVQRKEDTLLPLGIKARIDWLEQLKVECDSCEKKTPVMNTNMTIAIETKIFNIGRKAFGSEKREANQLIIPRESISSHHATITFKQGIFFIQDFSTYGTSVNNLGIKNKETALTNSSTICLASNSKSKVYLRFRILEPGEDEPDDSTLTITKDSQTTRKVNCRYCDKGKVTLLKSMVVLDHFID